MLTQLVPNYLFACNSTKRSDRRDILMIFQQLVRIMEHFRNAVNMSKFILTYSSSIVTEARFMNS